MKSFFSHMFMLIQSRARSIHLRMLRTCHALSEITLTQCTTKHGNVCLSLKGGKPGGEYDVQNVKLLSCYHGTKTVAFSTADTGSFNNNNEERFLCFE